MLGNTEKYWFRSLPSSPYFWRSLLPLICKIGNCKLQNNVDPITAECLYFFVGKTDTTITFSFLREVSLFLVMLVLG